VRLSEERIAVLARGIVDSLLDKELVDLEIAEDRFLFLIESAIIQDLKLEDQIDEEATEFLRKHNANLEEGSPEWEIELDRKREDLAVAKGYVIH
jgi:hypothetical protein